MLFALPPCRMVAIEVFVNRPFLTLLSPAGGGVGTAEPKAWVAVASLSVPLVEPLCHQQIST